MRIGSSPNLSLSLRTSPAGRDECKEVDPASRGKRAKMYGWAWHPALTLGAAVLIAGCSGAIRLSDNFEKYSDGQPVGGGTAAHGEGASIPGDPLFDRIYVTGDVAPGACNDSLFSVSSANPLSGQRSLVLRDARLPFCEDSCTEIGCEDRVTLIFEPNHLDNSDQPIFFIWQGQLQGQLRGGAGRSVVSLNIKEDLGTSTRTILEVEVTEDELLAGSSTVSSVSSAINHDFTAPHKIIVRVSPADESWAVQLSAEGLPTPPAGTGMPCSMANVICDTFPEGVTTFDPSNLLFFVSFDELKSADVGVGVIDVPRYRMDGVTITQQPS